MSNRDELAQVIAGTRFKPGTRRPLSSLEQADAILAAGYSKHSADDAAVERAAKAIHDLGAFAHSWEEREEDLKELYREDVRAVISALKGDEK